MIRIIAYLIISIFGIAVSLAQVKSEEILLKNGKIELPGTLTFTQENTPLIIWVHGSGPVNRNGNQPAQNIKANYIKQFRDAVNKEQIAFFSFDKRTANKNNIKFLTDIKLQDFALDVEEIINYFHYEKRFSKIILAGHSQGSLIAMLAAKKADKYISIAGAGETIDKTIIKQISKNNSTLGEAAKKQFDTLKTKGKIEVVNPFLMSVFAKQNQSFLFSWMQINPLEKIKKLTIPILIINGKKDIQVQVSDAETLKKSATKGKINYY
ncbi:alpha/beta hydrolase [Polaribacter sp. Hel1_85]|uniref:alpha/beta hydrolase n=1 Tax=Polaribacter sp. Hel1_85 TaxID=1250005 RepID=UPI00052E3BD5|nr:alpha/beta hydrolase [Polaribacter sp. Hel1_85]KGL62878.1 hypothetical protein PHEL85_2674 [Polaribacter sp. Hel1_85]